MDRDRLIELLISHQIEKLGIGQHTRRFLQVVEREFRDLAKMSDVELARELARRGLTSGPEAPPEPVDFSEDEEQDDGDACFLMRDMRRADDDWVPGYS